ncbi:flagellar motor protein MotA [Candidatus Kirkpatrickella diaphorinae]|uniref:Flagellar motor protein MotA n=1 Tax=Candidatus Kirkpatrickella diaphorinae TaxID=2984322 RepID=A0ABY6GJ02_9PROT|nr:flagellar motor protein MotA [Candidatus Kirkpatrickella diaphorinae]UYH51297.1 flagellar motor protein MotA [Candidatus Kirkpatrickella diaphorinae]
MTRPHRYLARMILFLVLVGLIGFVLHQTLYRAFMSNPVLDGFILAVLLIGILWNIRVALRLFPEVKWAETLRQSRTALVQPDPPRLLAPLARLITLNQGGDRVRLSFQASQAALDSLSGRLDEGREISRYLTSLLIFLGLLGTFYGLLLTVNAIAGVIGGLTAGDQNLDVMFDQLKIGLAQPLHGMATAFSGSMFGLAGALILGFLDLTAGQAQNRFFNEMEEWLVGQTSTASPVTTDNNGAAVPAYVSALLEQTAEHLESLQRILGKNEETRTQLVALMAGLQENMRQNAETISANQRALQRVADTNAAVSPYLKRMSEQNLSETSSEHAGDVMSRRMERLDATLAALSGAITSGRDDLVGEVRNGLRLLAKTVAAGSHDHSQPGASS